MRKPDAGGPAGWDRLESLYSTASSLAAPERAAFLDQECADNPELRRELDQLLACSPEAEGFFHKFSDAIQTAINEPVPMASDPLIGSTLGHYRVEARLGAGGMGLVYRAYDVQLQRIVALKLLSSHLTDDEHARERFLTEARAAAALDHPNICTIHEIGATDSGMPYIAMAFCPGETLKTRIAQGPLASSEAAGIALQMARGLAAAHARGIIHRDVKPANVMIGEDGLVKLVDFGLARLPDATVTAAGNARGTFAYMAPELLRGERADASTDLWALGVVLYEMLTGARPFRADSDAALVYAIVHQRPAPIEALRSDVPAELRRILDRLLHEEPDARYHDARDLVADLAPLAGASLQTAPSGERRIEHPRRRSRRFAAQSWRWVAMTGAAAGVLTVTWLGLGIRSSAPTEPSALPRVAVLFFHDDTPDRSAGVLVSGLSTGLINALMAIPALNVPSAMAMQPYRNRSLALSAIASELKAGWMIAGVVERNADSLVVKAELTDSTGRLLDTRRVTRADGSLLIEETVEEVAVMLRERLGEIMRERRWQAGTSSAIALALLRQAMQDRQTADSLMERTQPHAAIPQLYRADSALARAALADPVWPEPLIERGWIARRLGLTKFGLVAPDSGLAAVDRGIEYANAALRLGKDTARAYEIRGVLLNLKSAMSVRADPSIRARLESDAEKDLDAAIRADAALVRALDGMGAIQFGRGEFERARLTTERAYRADYYAEERVIIIRLFDTAFETGQDSLARQRCALIARRLPREWYGALCRLMLMTWSTDEPNPDSARHLVERAIALTPVAIQRGTAAQLSVLEVGVLARTVSNDSAARVLQRTRARLLRDSLLSANDRRELQPLEASVRIRIGDRDGAIELIRQYIEIRPSSRGQLSNSRIFKTLFDDPRLRAINSN